MHRPQMSLWTLLFLIQLIHTHSTTTTTPSLIAAGHQGIDETLSYYDPLSHPLPTLDHTHEGNHADWHITYKKRSLPLRLWKNDIIEPTGNGTFPSTPQTLFLSGTVPTIPGSYVRLSSFNGLTEGVISLGEHGGLLRIERVDRFGTTTPSHNNNNNGLIVYHQEDVKSHDDYDDQEDARQARLTKRGGVDDVEAFWFELDEKFKERVVVEKRQGVATATQQQQPRPHVQVGQRPPPQQPQQQPQRPQARVVQRPAPQQQQPHPQPQRPQVRQAARPQHPPQQQPQPRVRHVVQQTSRPPQPHPQQPRYQPPAVQSRPPTQWIVRHPSHPQPVPQKRPASPPVTPFRPSNPSQQHPPGSSSPVSLSRCSVGLIADYTFYESHKNEPGGIRAYMVSLFNEVSGHIHSQIGVSLVVKYMYVVTSPNDRSGLGRNVGDPTSSVKYINSKSARLPGFNADDLCVVHIMSSAEFHQEAVGVAYIGTLCSPGTNAGISTDKNGKMSRSDYTSVMMHETGHTLGSSHDSFFSKGMLCAPPFHRYVMYPQVQSKSRNAHRFSPCSMDAIRAIISDPKKRCWDAKGIRQVHPRGTVAVASSRPRQVVDYRRRVVVRTQQLQQPQQRVVVRQ